MQPVFALFDSGDRITRTPMWSKRICVIRCTPSLSGDKHYIMTTHHLPNREVTLESSPMTSIQPQIVYVKWQNESSQLYEKIHIWSTGMVINGSIPVIDCNFAELFVPRECNYSVRGDTDELCASRQRYLNNLRSDAIDLILSRYVSRDLSSNLIAPRANRTRRPLTPMPPMDYHSVDAYHFSDAYELDSDSDDDGPVVHVAIAPSATAPAATTASAIRSDIPKFVAELIKKEAIDKNSMCPISMESFSECSSLRLTSCYHLFESDSLQRWLLSKSTCPVCKQEVTSTLEF